MQSTASVDPTPPPTTTHVSLADLQATIEKSTAKLEQALAAVQDKAETAMGAAQEGKPASKKKGPGRPPRRGSRAAYT